MSATAQPAGKLDTTVSSARMAVIEIRKTNGVSIRIELVLSGGSETVK